MIKAVCFDFDGTLAQFGGDFGALQSCFGRKLGLSQTETRRIVELHDQLERQDGPMTFYSVIKVSFAEAKLVPPDNLEPVTQNLVAHYCAQMKLLPGTLETLNLCQAHDLPIALITNGTSDMQRAAVHAVGIRDYFRRVLVSGDADVAVRKPHPRIFRLACEALETKPEETLMVGDNLQADIEGALASGLQALHLGGRPDEAYDVLPGVAALNHWLKARL